MRLSPSFLTVALIFLVGCGKEEDAYRYTAPKQERAAAPEVAAGETKSRILGAIFPAKGQQWFVKLMGSTADVAAAEKGFQQFAQSIKFTDNEKEPIEWMLPEGWTRDPAGENQFVFRSFRIGDKTPPLKVGISSAGGDLLANINRWRGQVGLKDMPESELPRVTKQQDINGVKATLVDLAGPGGGGRPPMMR